MFIALTLALDIALLPIIHLNNRTLLSLGLDLSLIIEPYEHLGEVTGDDSDVGSVSENQTAQRNNPLGGRCFQKPLATYAACIQITRAS